MHHYASSETEPIELEKYDDEAAECHACGKIGRPRRFIHFTHLCQHFVALCGKCYRTLQRKIRET